MEKSFLCQGDNAHVSGASRVSGLVADKLSGLLWSPTEVTDETDGDATGDPEDAI